MTEIEQRITEVENDHWPSMWPDDDPFGGMVCHCRCGERMTGEEWGAHAAAAVVETLGLTRENYVTQELGIDPITLHHWQRWATAWEKTDD